MPDEDLCSACGEKPIYAKTRKLCTRCYGRWRTYGDPLGPDQPIPDPVKKVVPVAKPKRRLTGKVEHGLKGTIKFLKGRGGAEAFCLCETWDVFVPGEKAAVAIARAEAELNFHLDKHKGATSTG
jgi:hypothetical protein